ncbi:MAG: MFS transporter [Actinobacteria bacterium]|nr:MFS transporter [Actinomycetota bacterium]MBU1943071.1 MFS transporter [Actinomycetota bacterium]MBU2687982.1 MFS transporter [Actinomycetota bacterium]
METEEECRHRVTPPRTREPMGFKGLLAALGQRNYALFWSGALLSNIGNWIQTTALLWIVRESTGSNSWVAAVNLAAYLPVFLFALLAGVAADVYDKKRIVLITMGVQLLCALALGVSSSLGSATLPVIITTVFVAGVAYTFSAPAGVSFLPELVREEDMMSALSLSSAQFNIGRVVGPAVGAVILSAWSATAAFYINAVSFAFIIGAFILVRPLRPQERASRGATLRKVAHALEYAIEFPWRAYTLLALGAATFFGFSCTVLFPSLAKDVLGGRAGTFGLLMSMLGLGAAVGAPLVTYLQRRLAERAVIKAAILALGVLLVCLSLSRWVWLSAVLAAFIGCSYLMLGASVNTVLQARSRKDLRGRMVSLYSMMWLGLFGLGGQLIGLLADAWSVTAMFALGGATCVALAALLFAFGGLIEGACSSLGVEEPGAGREAAGRPA